MSQQQPRGWVGSLFHRRPSRIARTGAQPRARLQVEECEERAMPSISIPLNGQTWTAIGPSPITIGQGPGAPPSTGRINGIAVDPTSTNIMYVAADSGGIWRTNDGGKTWSPRTDSQITDFATIAMVHRTSGNTVYAFSQDGTFFVSTNGATTFSDDTPGSPGTPYQPFGPAASVNKLIVSVADPADQSKDILFAAVGYNLGVPPSTSFGGSPGSGIWRSTDGGTTWTNIVDPTAFPFTTNPNNPTLADSLAFTDVVADPRDPANPNVLYAAVGNAGFGDPTNGVYKTTNAMSATPTWSLLIGGSAFVPGEIPGNIKLAISPSLPSVVFASIAQRDDPQTGFAPLLGVFRTLDGGLNWTPVLLANPNDPVNDPNNYMSISGEDNNVIEVAPNGSTDPNQQTVILAGYGNNLTNTVLISGNSGTSFTQIGIGSNGVGTYPNVHDGGFDSLGRLVLATGGGIYRLDSTGPVTWESLNGNVGPNGLDVAQFNGFALNPTNADQAVGNISYAGDVGGNFGVSIHNAILFSDSQGAGNSAYGWQTVDATGFDGNVGTGQVIYNPFNPNIVYRVITGSAGVSVIRQSLDGGRTWAGASTGFQAYPRVDGSALYIPPLAIDPSSPNRLFSGYNQIQVTDDNGQTWSTSMQVTVANGKTAIPALPSSGVTNAKGGVIGLTAIGVGRESGADVNGIVAFPISGVTLFVGTEDDATRNPTNNDPTDTRANVGPQLYVNLIPNSPGGFPWPPPGSMLNWNNHSWANITPTDNAGISLLTGEIEQVLVDPSNNSTIYVYTSSGQVFRGTNFLFGFDTDANKNIIGETSITWTDLTGDLPAGSGLDTTVSASIAAGRPQELALDLGTDPAHSILYCGTGQGVFALSNPTQDFTGSGTTPTWGEIGLDASGKPTLPIAPVTVVALNTSTGILAAATYGRGVYEIQVRGLISGHVFTDTNGNGKFDIGEPAFAGVTVEVLDENNGGSIAAVTTTDANGFYQFRSLLAGNYQVVELNSTTAGEIQTTGEPTGLSTFTTGSTVTVDFGFFQAGTISGVKYLDGNGNGVRDNGEPGLAGFTIYIDYNNNGVLDLGEPAVVSASNGAYSFTGLGPAFVNGLPNPQGGPFHVREVQQPGYVASNPPIATGLVVQVDSGAAVTGANFGNHHPFPPGSNAPAPPVLVTGEDAGGTPTVVERNLVTNQIVLSFNAYAPTFRGGVRVATGFFSGGTLPDIVTAAGPGGGPHVEVFNGTDGTLIYSFFAYASSFTGGVNVAVGDIDGDGKADIITGADAGGGPHVEVFLGKDLQVGNFTPRISFMAYDPSFAGGVRVASADVDGDGLGDIITAAGPGGGPHVKVFSGKTLGVIRSFFAYATTFTGGVYIAAADVNGDGFADIITGPGKGGGPHLRIFNGNTNGTLLSEAFVFPVSTTGQISSQINWTSGLRVATTDINEDGRPDIIVGPGAGKASFVRILDAATLNVFSPPGQLTIYNPAFLGGIYVAGD